MKRGAVEHGEVQDVIDCSGGGCRVHGIQCSSAKRRRRTLLGARSVLLGEGTVDGGVGV